MSSPAPRVEFTGPATADPGDADVDAVGPLRWIAGLATAGIGVLWVLLAIWRPDTTWHAAPFLFSAAAPWVLDQRVEGNPRAMTLLVRVGTAAAAAGVAVTVALWSTGLLRGPVVTGRGPAALEAVLFSLLGAGGVVTLAALRARRRRAS